MNVRPAGGIDSIEFTVGGPTDEALVESGLAKANEHFRGADINSAFTFAVSYLASLIVIFEARVLCERGQFEFDAFTEQLREAVKAGHELPPRRMQ